MGKYKEARDDIARLILSAAKNDPFIKHLIELDIDFEMTGGALIDYYDGRVPKDYDFITKLPDEVIDNCKFLYETSYSKTYRFTYGLIKAIVQELKTDRDDFDFTVSQMKLARVYDNCTGNKEFKVTDIDVRSVTTKVLIPTSFTEENAINALYRIPHFIKKGFVIPPETYLNLLDILLNNGRRPRNSELPKS